MDHKTENNPVIRVPPTLVAAQQMLEYAPVAMLLVNSQGEIQHLNSAADQLFGYSKESLIGKQVETLVPDDLKQKHKLGCRLIKSEPQTHGGEFCKGHVGRSVSVVSCGDVSELLELVDAAFDKISLLVFAPAEWNVVNSV